MGESRWSRWPWFVSGITLVLAGVTGAVATYLWWLPCKGQMLLGSPLEALSSDSQFTHECLRRMDEGTPFPLATDAPLSAPGLLAVITATMALVAVSWLMPVATDLLPAEEYLCPRRVAAALPGLALLAVALLGIGAYWVPGFETLEVILDYLLLHALIAAALVVLVMSRVRHPWRYLVASLPLTAMGILGVFVDYAVMDSWSESDWDAPPGSGYLSTAVLMFSGIALLVMTAVGDRRGRRPRVAGGSPASAPEQVQQVDPVA